MDKDQQARFQNIAFHGERIRGLRHIRGISAGQLAEMADCATHQIYRLERNERPNAWGVTVARLAVALDTTTDFLLGLTDDPNS
jgi:transcriptional regulator with XRE-family HTH domain